MVQQMKITYKDGDFLSGPEPYKAHGCNAQGAFGAGAAGAIERKHPDAALWYRAWHRRNGLTLGEVIYFRMKETTIAHCITQLNYGRVSSTRYVDYPAVRQCMTELNHEAGSQEVAMPKIGAGLAGGNWKVIEQIIEEEFTDSIPVVYIL
jgi:O-acetyl-ADP-ribose deacetylase (regulator of RNase III)